MLTTNLLPPEEKKMIWLEETRRLVVFFGFVLSSVLVIASILLLSSYIPMAVERRDLARILQVEEASSERLEIHRTLERVGAFRLKASSLKQYVATPSRASRILQGFFEEAGEGVEIASLSIKKDGALIIRGVAATRRDLLRFEKTLRDSTRFSELSLPLSSIVRDININFSMEGRLKAAHGL